ncbi:MAG: Gfo/Idh/MocA family oxidoreductase [Actinobacteria bacterium]|nr:Gfo/Idh/MocA family oxidoreductase [Actinomycetota bacterium]
MSKDLDVALIGYGLAGKAFHAPLISVTPGLRLAAIVTSNPRRREQAARLHPDAVVLDDAEQVWERADDLDVVVIAAANRVHAPLTSAALRAGLAAVVDKPLAATSAQARQLVDLAAREGRLLTVFHNRRWDGDFLTLGDLVAGGRLGRVHRFESRFERWRPDLKPGWRESADPEDAGGILYDLGSHLIDQALWLFGAARRVYAEVDTRRRDAEVDDDVFVAVTHDSGVRSHLWASALAAQLGPRMRVLGDSEAYVKHGLDVQEDLLRAGRLPSEPGWGREPRHAWGLLGAGDGAQPVETRAGDWPAFYGALVDALRDDGPPPVDPKDAVAGLEVIEAARQAAASGAVVEP